MSKIPSILERELKSMRPRELDQAFLSRLTACAEESFTSLSEEETDFESQLRAIAPRNAQASLQAKLLDSIGDAPFSVDEKIVLFNRSRQAPTQAAPAKRNKIIRLNFAAAAAVALLGALTALMLPTANPGAAPLAVASAETGNIVPAPPHSSPNTAPAVFNRYNRNLTETSDEGVFWHTENQPYRVYRQSYTDRVTQENAAGETIERKQPHIEHVLIPEKID